MRKIFEMTETDLQDVAYRQAQADAECIIDWLIGAIGHKSEMVTGIKYPLTREKIMSAMSGGLTDGN